MLLKIKIQQTVSRRNALTKYRREAKRK